MDSARTPEHTRSPDGTGTRPAAEGRLPGRFVGSVAFGTVLQPINSSMIAVALVSISREFHAGAGASWLVSALYLATAVAAPAAGRLADLLGARRVFSGGLVLIVLASAAAPFAPNLGTLIACRIVLGLGTAAQFPSALAMIRRVADRTRTRPSSALAALGVCGQTTVALGPTIGGLLVGAFGWESIFLVNIPLAVIAFLAVRKYGPADEPRAAGSGRGLATLDIPGMLLFSAAMAALMFFLLSLAGHPQWYWLAALVPLLALLVWRESRAAVPFLDLRLFRNRALTATFGRTVLTYAAFYCIFYGMPQWLEEARGLNASASGLVVLPIAAVGVASTLAANRLQRRHGVRLPLLVGSAFLLVGGLILTLPGTATPIALLVLTCAVLGLPNGFNSQGNQNAVYGAASAEQTGAASGLYRTCQYIGANIAAALLALLFHGSGGSGGLDAAALHRMGFTVAGISAVLLLGALFSRTLKQQRPQRG